MKTKFEFFQIVFTMQAAYDQIFVGHILWLLSVYICTHIFFLFRPESKVNFLI